MEPQGTNIQKIHEYLDQLEKGKQKKRNKVIAGITLVAAFFLIGGAIVTRTSLTQKSNNWSYDEIDTSLPEVEELSHTFVVSFFHEGNKELWVKDPITGQPVRMTTEKDYWTLLDRVPFSDIQGVAFDSASLAGAGTFYDSEEETPFLAAEGSAFANLNAITFVQFRGNQTPGSLIRFLITNYQPAVSYQVNLSDGTQIIGVKEQFNHTFTEAGEYRIDLLGFHSGSQVVFKRMFMTISADTLSPEEAAPEIQAPPIPSISSAQELPLEETIIAPIPKPTPNSVGTITSTSSPSVPLSPPAPTTRNESTSPEITAAQKAERAKLQKEQATKAINLLLSQYVFTIEGKESNQMGYFKEDRKFWKNLFKTMENIEVKIVDPTIEVYDDRAIAIFSVNWTYTDYNGRQNQQFRRTWELNREADIWQITAIRLR